MVLLCLHISTFVYNRHTMGLTSVNTCTLFVMVICFSPLLFIYCGCTLHLCLGIHLETNEYACRVHCAVYTGKRKQTAFCKNSISSRIPNVCFESSLIDGSNDWSHHLSLLEKKKQF